VKVVVSENNKKEAGTSKTPTKGERDPLPPKKMEGTKGKSLLLPTAPAKRAPSLTKEALMAKNRRKKEK